MRLQARVTFAMRDLDRLKVIQAVIDGDLKPYRAAERLGLTSRQVRRLARRCEREGPIGLIAKRFNRPSNNMMDPALRCRVLVILRELYVDDATSRLMVVLFTGTESTFAYFEATRQYLKLYGEPLAFYSDTASVFRINNKSPTGGAGHTQFGRALYELNIDGICANTPAAKGRVERAHLSRGKRLRALRFRFVG